MTKKIIKENILKIQFLNGKLDTLNIPNSREYFNTKQSINNKINELNNTINEYFNISLTDLKNNYERGTK